MYFSDRCIILKVIEWENSARFYCLREFVNKNSPKKDSTHPEVEYIEGFVSHFTAESICSTVFLEFNYMILLTAKKRSHVPLIHKNSFWSIRHELSANSKSHLGHANLKSKHLVFMNHMHIDIVQTFRSKLTLAIEKLR